MNKCPALMHTYKGRERALIYTSNIEKLTCEKTYTYKLFHQYDNEPTPVFVEVDIAPTVFEVLLAYILFEASEIDECYALCQTEIAEPVLNKLYGVKVLSEQYHVDEEFDMYYVWEKWCGLYTSVLSIDILKREGLKEALEKIIPIEV